MRKKLVSLALITAVCAGALSACGTSETKDTSDKAASSQATTSEAEQKSSAVALTRTANSDTFPLNGKDIFMEKDNSS